MRPLAHRPFHDGSALFSPPPGRNAPPLSIVVAVAHPDDETIALGALMPLLTDARFVYATDGAPRRLADARAAGFGSCRSYARARREELESAFAIAGLDIGRSHFCEIPDQDAAHELTGLTRRIKRILEQARAALVITHPYEGGHPDHDATAFAVHNACRLLAAEKQPVPRVLEAPYYHNRGGRMATGDFLPRAGDGSQAVTLSGEERALKSRLLGCFATQEQTLRAFPTDRQCFRPAPAYDFERLPHAGTLLYEAFGWGLTGAQWRRLGRTALHALGLPHTEVTGGDG